MPNTRCGRTPNVALTDGSRKLTSMWVAYLAFIRSMTRCSRAGSVTTAAWPSMTTGSEASVVITQLGLDRRFLDLREPTALENHSMLSSHMAQTGIRCGRPTCLPRDSTPGGG